MKKTRFQQRFQNFEKSFSLLQKAIQIESLSEIERAGLIQFFELTFELAWKTLKDYLESEGQSPVSPRETLKQAFQNGLLQEGHVWMEALSDRNLSTHTYDEATSLQMEKTIREKYFPALQELHKTLKEKLKS